MKCNNCEVEIYSVRGRGVFPLKGLVQNKNFCSWLCYERANRKAKEQVTERGIR